jgi:hypothetical protein
VKLANSRIGSVGEGPIVVVLVIALLVFPTSIGVFQSAGTKVRSAGGTANDFVVPVTIGTYGNAWRGYLSFGLWQFSPVDLSPLHSYLVVMNTNGQLLYLRESNELPSYWPVKYIAEDTLMFMGEPDSLATHFWHLSTNKTDDFPNVWGHHDIEYNPFTRTFLTLRDYIRVIDGKNVLMDHIIELDRAGDVLWSWDTYADGHIGLDDECPCNDTAGGSSGYLPGQTLIDLTHSNSLQWEFNENMSKNIIYLNMRAQNTFCKINKTTDRLDWCVGEHGSFRLYDTNGRKVQNLWYHSHDLTEIRPNVFTMFDNDYHNTTLPCPQSFNGTGLHSRLLEITVNEQNMTAQENWSWSAPSDYWTPYWGSVNVLPNGDVIGAFGSNSHYVPNSAGASVVEVNPNGKVVRTYIFPYGWGIYRVEPIGIQTSADYDGLTHTSDFNITLRTHNELGGVGGIYYRINNGTTESVSVDGEPQITTVGANNTLEFWSVDKAGIEETPHNMLTGIKLARSAPNSEVGIPADKGLTEVTVILATAVVLMLVTFLYLRRIGRSEKKHRTMRTPVTAMLAAP